jgi:hypothetical protein
MESLQGRDMPRDTFNRKEDMARAFFPDTKLNREGAENRWVNVSSWLRPTIDYTR